MKLVRFSAATIARIVLCAFAGLFSFAPLRAEISLPAIFSDNMVVQQGVPFKIWGSAAPGETITVSLGNKAMGTAVADANGRWTITGPAVPAGKLPDLTISGTTTLSVKNLLGGEVWLCSGQSNMKMTVAQVPECDYGGVLNAEAEVAQANYPDIRIFNGKWVVCSPSTVAHWSATAYFFGRDLYRELKSPVGLITEAIGGTAIEYWVSPASFTNELTQKAIDAYRPFYLARQQLYQSQLEASRERRIAGKPEKQKEPRPLIEPEKYPRGFSKLFTEHIDPVAGYPLRGVLWYQGESNTMRSGAYSDLLSALIAGWREAWNSPDLPFVVVQLANYNPPEAKGGLTENWPTLRSLQAEVARRTPHVGLAVTIDVGDPNLLHPRNKQEVGHRAALVALQMTYTRPVIASGPILHTAARKGSKVLLVFENAKGGLTARHEPLNFAVAGPNGVFHPAQAQIHGDRIEVSCNAVPKPDSVRYAWMNNPEGLFYNAAGLPATPFEAHPK